MTAFQGRTWIEIDLDKIISNYEQSKALCVNGAKVCAVLKSNAYGHGAVTVAQHLQQAGCDDFAVSCIREALELRHNGISGSILVMGLCEGNWYEQALQAQIIFTIASVEEAKRLSQTAVQFGLTAEVHLKVDTGMHRLGFEAEDYAGMLETCRMPGIQVSGIYSHLALHNEKADIIQHDRLVRAADYLKAQGIEKLDVHLCDSIGMVRYPQWQYSRVRTGAMLFGVRPSRTDHIPFACQQALTFKTTVAQVRKVAKGECIGYSDDAPLQRDSMIATLCAGYGDGYPRCLSNVASVAIKGQRAPVCGLVCMDQMMVDVTEIDGVKPGDEVTLLGGDISYAEYADWMHSNRNEAITILSRRPIRVYYRNGDIVKTEDLLLGGG